MKKKQRREKRKKHKTSKTTKSRKRERSRRSPSSSNRSVAISNSSPGPSPKPSKKRSRDFSSKPNDADSIVPLNCLLHKRNLLAKIAVNCLDADKLASITPFCLVDRTKDELIQKVTEELEVMSKKRILAALEGKEASSSESEESEQEAKSEEMGQGHASEVNTPKTYDSNDRVSLTREVTSQCPLEDGEIINDAD